MPTFISSIEFPDDLEWLDEFTAPVSLSEQIRYTLGGHPVITRWRKQGPRPLTLGTRSPGGVWVPQGTIEDLWVLAEQGGVFQVSLSDGRTFQSCAFRLREGQDVIQAMPVKDVWPRDVADKWAILAIKLEIY